MISLTLSAVNHLRALLAERHAAADAGLRLLVEKGGCAGMQYTMKIDQPAAGDQVFTTDRVALIIDPASLAYLDNCEIDYADALNDSGFKIHNPNAARSCGCGTSFEPLVAGNAAG